MNHAAKDSRTISDSRIYPLANEFQQHWAHGVYADTQSHFAGSWFSPCSSISPLPITYGPDGPGQLVDTIYAALSMFQIRMEEDNPWGWRRDLLIYHRRFLNTARFSYYIIQAFDSFISASYHTLLLPCSWVTDLLNRSSKQMLTYDRVCKIVSIQFLLGCLCQLRIISRHLGFEPSLRSSAQTCLNIRQYGHY